MSPAAGLPLTDLAQADEAARIAAVAEVEALVPRDDPRLRRLARLASVVTGLPTALITVGDQGKQKVLVAEGTPYDGALEDTFCPLVVEAGEPLVVEDAASDARFASSREVAAEGGFHVFAGVPLRSPEGLAVGVLCALGPAPRALGLEERRLLEDLASLVEDDIHGRRTSAALAEAAGRLQHIVGMASHDLRGALGAIVGYAEMLGEMLEPRTQEAEFTSTIGEVGRRAAALMQELLETAMLEGGALRLEPEPFDLSALVRTAVRDFQAQATRKRQRFVQDVPAGVMATGDPRRLRQVLDNLISNAVKYAPHGSSLYVAVSGGEVPGFVVEDEGPGFSPAERERAFTPFARIANEPTGGEASIGLGLSIAAEMVRLHGGTLAMEEGRSGRGTRFVVTLPG